MVNLFTLQFRVLRTNGRDVLYTCVSYEVCYAPLNGNHAGGRGLLVFVHQMISKTYYTCLTIDFFLAFFFVPASLGLLLVQRIAFFLYQFFSGHYYFSILGHLLHSFPVISLCFRRTFRFVYFSVLSPSTYHCITPGS